MMGLTASLMFVVGYFLFISGTVLGIPGAKFFMFAPFFSFMLTVIVSCLRKIGVVSLISCVFAFIMSFISIFMGLAILVSGIFTDIIALILFKGYTTKKKIVFAIPFYPFFSFITASIVVNYVTGNKLFMLAPNPLTLIALSIIIYTLGFIGSNVATKVVVSRILQVKNRKTI
ncbi:hypothetical protein [Thermohalobacter berrensis]|uniref:Uncharacterized protein n=1 Tax=Thermohalobacter berrensis TaxID=99594 RepID=A0A419T7S0_9FIRM|nr:hypothetical protein [Thermohalobacter berrensis]RKD33428.1 hypothetical protein BET03_09240 [Thermohalobacter berrensis]